MITSKRSSSVQRVFNGSAAALLLPLVVACSALPKDGPYGAAVRSEATQTATPNEAEVKLGYAIVPITPDSIRAVNSFTLDHLPSFPSNVRGHAEADVRISVGDKVSITVFEASSGGLFIPTDAGSRAGNFVQIPSQQVDNKGSIQVPYAGTIVVQGRTTQEVAAEIVRRLANRAIEPQVVVTIDNRLSGELAVLGDVNNPIRFSLDPGGTKLLGALARAGGNKYQSYETLITLQRAGKTYTASLASITKDPVQNIQLIGGDTVFVAFKPRVFMVFGATPAPGTNGASSSRRFTFDQEQVSLAEAVAKSGGLDNTRADPGAVFLYRMEDRETLRKLGIDVSKFSDETVPTVFSIDMRRPESLFLAQKLMVRNQDVVFVADSQSTDLVNFLTVLRTTNSTVGEIQSTVNLFK